MKRKNISNFPALQMCTEIFTQPSSSAVFYRSFESHGILHESPRSSERYFYSGKKDSKRIRGILGNAVTFRRDPRNTGWTLFGRGTGEFGRTVNKNAAVISIYQRQCCCTPRKPRTGEKIAITNRLQHVDFRTIIPPLFLRRNQPRSGYNAFFYSVKSLSEYLNVLCTYTEPFEVAVCHFFFIYRKFCVT